MKKSYVFFAIVLAMIVSCKENKKKVEENQQKTVVKKVEIPVFNADSAYYFTEKQVAFGPRVPNTKAQELCANYLVTILKRYCKNVTVQEFQSKAWDGTLLKGKNIIASFNPDTNNRIFFSSHWDSRPYADYDPDAKNNRKPILGANDGAAGVGILMEIARLFSEKQPKIGVDLVLFDVEDYGEPKGTTGKGEDNWCLGSQYWAKNPHKQGYFAKYGVLLDMVAAKNAVFTMENTSMYYAPDIMNMVWNTANSLGYSNYFSTEQTGGLIDDHLYINKIAKIPTVDIVQHDPNTVSGFFPYWHTVKDDMSNIDKTTLTVVGNTLLTVAYGEE
ncbi:MAG: M28 family peptidase [Bacteroidetes bacterium]|nr:M28 family peptidase [Bacteroidota bacterium]